MGQSNFRSHAAPPPPKKNAREIDSPLKGAKHNSGGHDVTDGAPAQGEILLEHRQGDPAGEPEDHGDGIESEDGVLVGGGGEEARGEGEVEEGEEGPDGGEEEEVDAWGGGGGEGGGVVPVDG